MPIYEYYCPDNHTIYQFYAKTLAQGNTVPKCPADPKFRMRKIVSAFAVTGRAKEEKPAAGKAAGDTGDPAEDARMEAAMNAMESEFSSVDENDPRAMARMMRRMSELTGEKIDGEMEEVVRKLEEGADPDSLEDQLGGGGEGEGDPYGDEMGMGGEGAPPPDPKEPRHRFRVRRPPARDPKLYDYE
ncbi:MAG TPA: FmdB family transcriptional regulator [Opitutus sp.]|nr:FmdB family transcriptional regulator [Opitutus sp.]